MAGKKRRSTEKNKGEAGRKEKKKRMRRGSSSSSATEPESPTPVKQPSRERKPIDRLLSTPSSSTLKPAPRDTLSFGQGSGTKLKDIPHVSLKIRKHKTVENLQVLHNILYGNRTKDRNLKSNILNFSGFAWLENEAKLRARAKKLLERCNTEILLDFCLIVNIECVKASMKKEEISEMLMEFLESPCVTTDDIPAVKKAKRRIKVEKMLDKCNKEILLDFCEILDIEPGKASTEKEEISVKLIKILESFPCTTTEVVPAAKNGKRSKEDIETIRKASLVRKTKRQRKSKNQLALDEDESEDTVDSNDPSASSNDHKYAKSCEREQEEEESEQEVEESDHDEIEEEHDESEQEEEENDDDESKQEEEEGDHDEIEEEHDEGEQEEEENDDDESEQEEEEGDHDESEQKEEENDHDESEEEESDEGEPAETIKGSKGKQLSSMMKKNISPARMYSKKGSSITTSNKVEVQDESRRPEVSKSSSKGLRGVSGTKSSSTKKSKRSKKQSGESEACNKEQGNVNSAENLNNGPSTSDLRAAITEIIKQVDINTTTFSDVIRQLGDHFNVDLTDRNTEVKKLTMNVLHMFFPDEDESSEDEDDEEDGGTD